MVENIRGLGSADDETRQRVSSEGGHSQEKENNPGNFANRPQEDIEDAARKSGGR